MISTGVLTLVGIAGLVLAFFMVLSRRGIAAALVSLCWVPLTALILGFAAHQSLGYAFLGILMVILVCSIALALVGAVLIVRAVRARSGPLGRLVLGTVVAASPAVLLLGSWLFKK